MNYPGHRFALGLFATVLVGWALAMLLVMRDAVLPAEATGTMLVVFEPGIESDEAFSSITRAGALPIRKTAFGFIWVVNGDAPGLAGRLIAEGAIGAYRELPLPAEIAGCVAVVDDKISNAFGT